MGARSIHAAELRESSASCGGEDAGQVGGEGAGLVLGEIRDGAAFKVLEENHPGVSSDSVVSKIRGGDPALRADGLRWVTLCRERIVEQHRTIGELFLI